MEVIQPAINAGAPLLSMTDIEKSFPGVRAIRHGHLELRLGEVHAFMGENGAGKNTLIARALARNARILVMAQGLTLVPVPQVRLSYNTALHGAIALAMAAA